MTWSKLKGIVQEGHKDLVKIESYNLQEGHKWLLVKIEGYMLYSHVLH